LDTVQFLCATDVRLRLPEQQRPTFERRVGDGQPSLVTWRNCRVFHRPLFTAVSHINALCKRQSENVAKRKYLETMLTNQYSMHEQIKGDQIWGISATIRSRIAGLSVCEPKHKN